MSPVRILLRAYYEQLHDRMETARADLVAHIDAHLPAEIARRHFGPMRPDQVKAYREACLAFIDERLETYNPIGIQYTFDRTVSRSAAELEFQLDWYNSRSEFAELVDAARALTAEQDVSDEGLADLAGELIRRAGAFPDRSILAGYTEKPMRQKLPDFLVALAIEEVICGRDQDVR
jgi:hypothetical protein